MSTTTCSRCTLSTKSSNCFPRRISPMRSVAPRSSRNRSEGGSGGTVASPVGTSNPAASSPSRRSPDATIVHSILRTWGKGGYAEESDSSHGNQSTKVRTVSHPEDKSNYKSANLSNRDHYDSTEDGVRKIFYSIEQAVADAKGRFLGRNLEKRFRVADLRRNLP